MIITSLLLAVSVFSTTSQHAQAESYFADNLAFPLNVSPGYNVTLVVNQTPLTRYMHSSGIGPNQQLEYWESINGGAPHEFIDAAGTTVMHAATYNFTFETSGRIAIAYLLSDFCFNVGTPTHSDYSCPPFEIFKTTSFELFSPGGDINVLRVDGDVDAYFFDQYLRPLGQATEMTYECEIWGIVVVAPHGGSANITFSFSSASLPPLNLVFILAPLLAAVAISIVLIVIVRRQKKREGDRG